MLLDRAALEEEAPHGGNKAEERGDRI